MRKHRLLALALSVTFIAPVLPACAQDSAPPTDTHQQMTQEQKKGLKQQEKANKAQAKADKAKQEALDSGKQKKADKAQDKADKEARKAAPVQYDPVKP